MQQLQQQHADTQPQQRASTSHTPYASLQHCYDEERTERAASCARSKDLIQRARTLLEPMGADRPPVPAPTPALSDPSSRPTLARVRSPPPSAAASSTAQARLQGPTVRQYGVGGGHHARPPHISLLLADGPAAMQSLRSAEHGGDDKATADPVDPAALARQKARARLSAPVDADDESHVGGRLLSWSRRVEWLLCGLLASLYMTLVTPFSTAFFSSVPARWVDLNAPPFNNPRVDLQGHAVPGGPFSYPYFERGDGDELHWYSATVLPWLLADFAFSMFFLLEIYISLLYPAQSYLYADSITQSKEEEEQERAEEAERQRERAQKGGATGLCGRWLHGVCDRVPLIAVLRTKRGRVYLKRGLCIDLAACCVPFELWAVAGGSIRTCFFLRAIRIWWVRRVPLYLGLLRARFLQSVLGRPRAHTQRIAFLLLGILVAIHWFACLWFFLTAFDSSDAQDGTGAHNSWLKDSCVSVRDCSSLSSAYLLSLYFSFGTFGMMGCNDVIPYSTREFLLNIVILWLGFITEKIVVATITAAMNSVGAAQQAHDKRMALSLHFMTQQQLPASMRHQVSAYGDYMWSKFSNGTEGELLADLPISLRKRVLKHLLSELVSGSEYFEGMPDKLIQSVCLFLRPCVLPPNVIVCYDQPYGRDLYFLSRGDVERMAPDGVSVLTSIQAGECFGVMRMFSANQQRQEEAADSEAKRKREQAEEIMRELRQRESTIKARTHRARRASKRPPVPAPYPMAIASAHALTPPPPPAAPPAVPAPANSAEAARPVLSRHSSMECASTPGPSADGGPGLFGFCKTTAFCEIYVLHDDDLSAVLHRWPAERQQLLERARELQRKMDERNQAMMQQLGLSRPRTAPDREPLSYSTKVTEMIRSASDANRHASSQLELHSLAHAAASKRDVMESAARHRWWQVIIAPASRFRLVWSLLSLLALLYLSISVPVTAMIALSPFLRPGDAHYPESWLRDSRVFGLNLLVDCFFALDIYLHANHFAFIKQGMVVRNIRSIRAHYITQHSDVRFYLRAVVHAGRMLGRVCCSCGSKRRRVGHKGYPASSSALPTRVQRSSASTSSVSASGVGLSTHGDLLNGLLLDVLMSLPFEALSVVPSIGVAYGGLLRINRLLRLLYLFYYFRFVELFLLNAERAREPEPSAGATAKGAVASASAPSPAVSRRSVLAALWSSFVSVRINAQFLHVVRYLLVLCLALWMLGFAWILVSFSPSVRGVSWLERDELQLDGSVTATFVRSLWLVLLSRTFDAEPVSDVEMVCTFVITLIGMFLVPTIVGLLEHLVENMDAVANAFEEKRTIVRTYIHRRNAPAKLQARVIAYYDFMWAKHSVDEDHIEQHLPDKLRSSIAVKRFEHLLPKFDFIRGCDAAFVADFAAALRFKVVPPQLRYYTAGSVATEMIVVVDGEMRLEQQGHKAEIAHSQTLKPGAVYGRSAMLSDPPPIRTESVVSLEYTQLVCLSRESLLAVLDLHPSSHELISRSLERETSQHGDKVTRNLDGAATPNANPPAVALGRDSVPSPSVSDDPQAILRKRPLRLSLGTPDPAVEMSTLSPSAAALDQPQQSESPPLTPVTTPTATAETVILPTSRTSFVWHLLCLLINLYQLVMIPLRISFLADPAQYRRFDLTPVYLLDFAGDAFFVADLCVRIRWMAVLRNGELLRTHRRILMLYLQSGFITDALAALPLDLFALMAGVPAISLPYYRLNKLLRVTRQPMWFTVLEQSIEHNSARVSTSILRSTQLILTAAQVSHVVACVWFGITFEGHGDSFRWLTDGTWVAHENLQTASASWQYHRSVYWSLSVMCLMYQDDILPRNVTEMSVFIVVMLLGVFVYAAFIANFVTLLTHENSHTQPFYDHVQQITQFMDTQRLPSELRQAIHAYYQRVLVRHQAIEESLVYDVLPDFFRGELTHALARPVLQRMPALSSVSPDFLHHLLGTFQPQMFVPHQFIVRMGQISDRLFLLIKGAIERWDASGHVMQFLKDGECFGWASLLRPRLRKTSMLPVVFCDTFTCPHKQFIDVLTLFPEQMQILYGKQASWATLGGDDDDDAALAKSAGATVHGSRAAIIAAETEKRLQANELAHRIRQQYHDDASMEHLRVAAARSKREAATRAAGQSEPASPLFPMDSAATKRDRHLSQVGSLVESVLPPLSSSDVAHQSLVQRSRLFYGQLNLIPPVALDASASPTFTAVTTIAAIPDMLLANAAAAAQESDDTAEEKSDGNLQHNRQTHRRSRSQQQPPTPPPYHMVHDSSPDCSPGASIDLRANPGIPGQSECSDDESGSSSDSDSLSLFDEYASGAAPLHRRGSSSQFVRASSTAGTSGVWNDFAVDSLAADDVDPMQDQHFLSRARQHSTRAASSIRKPPKTRNRFKEKARVIADAQRWIHRASLAAVQDHTNRIRSPAGTAAAPASPRSPAHSDDSLPADSQAIELASLTVNEVASDAAESAFAGEPQWQEEKHVVAHLAESDLHASLKRSPESSLVDSTQARDVSVSVAETHAVASTPKSAHTGSTAGDMPPSRVTLMRSATTASLMPDPEADLDASAANKSASTVQTRRRSVLEVLSSNPLFAGPQLTVRQAHISSPWVKSSFHRHVWGTLSLCFLIYYVALVPFDIAFYTTSATSRALSFHVELLLMGWIADLFFAVDIVLRITTFVRLEADGRVLTGWPAARRYLRSKQFVAHCVQAAPLDIVLLLTGQSIVYVYWSRCTRLLRLHQLPSMLKHCNALLVDLHWHLDSISLRLIKILLFFCTWTHVMSCVAFYIGCREPRSVSWLFIDVEDPSSLDDSAFWYVRCLWWVTASSHGTETRYPPTTTVTMLVASFLQLLSAGTDVMFIGTFTIRINAADASDTRFNQKLTAIKRYLQFRHMPLGLRRRILDYYNYLWVAKRGVSESVLLSDVPLNLRSEVSVYRSSFILTQVPLFAQLDVGIIRAIAVHLTANTVPPGEYVVEAGDVGREMYFIERGSVEVIDPATREIRGRLHAGAFFGELALLTGARRAMSVRSGRSCFVELFVLARADFDAVLALHPSLRDQLLSKLKAYLH